MRVCGTCGKSPRGDDSMQTVQYTGEDGATVGAICCTPCAATLAGHAPPKPQRYGSTQTGYPWRVCGLCRIALRDDDLSQPIRLAPSDVEGSQQPAGCYSACKDCIAHYKPVVHARLKAEGYPVPPLAAFHGNWLF